ncbi:MAG: LD-carboxypeptidase [Lentisphaeria bacterium]|jgi:muramoyltetrapeptide carboxypeptidase
MQYTAPKQIPVGSKVAIVAPASPFKSDELAASLNIIRRMGFVPVLGPNVTNLKSDSIHAASVKDRVEELMWAFSDPTLTAVITTCGGCGSAAVLPYLDYGVILRNRKPLLGMSDISALNNGILARCGLISINGQNPNVRLDEGREIYNTDCNSLKLAFDLMSQKKTWGSTPFQNNPYLPRAIRPGKASGYAIGCNNDTFIHLLGTPFMPDCEGAILFIEDVGKSGEVMARQLLHLEIAGVLEAVAGIVIGEFSKVPKMSKPAEPYIEDVLEEYLWRDKPTVFGYNFSHGPYTAPIPVGALCHVDAETRQVFFDFQMA